MTYVKEQINKASPSSMKNFGISELERYSGIKAHTLRTWEVRYGIPKPERNKSNSRIYSLRELEEVLHLAVLNSNGHKISRLSCLSQEQIAEKLKRLTGADERQRLALSQLLIAMHALRIEEFEAVLNHCFSSWPAYTVLQEVIYPFLTATNLFWQGSRLTEEHLVVTVLRRKMIHAIEKIDFSVRKERKVMLFLTSTRQLDLALLYACYFLTHAGVKVIYMGNDISVDNMVSTFEIIKPNYLYTYLPAKNNFQFDKMATVMNELLPEAVMIFTTQPGNTAGRNFSDKIISRSFDEALLLLVNS